MKKLLFLTSIFFFIIYSFSCKDNPDVNVYNVQNKNSHHNHPGSYSEQSMFKWTKPKNWKKANEVAMAIGSWEIKGKAQDSAKATIVVIKSKLNNMNEIVNRWREQVALKTVNDAELKKLGHKAQGKLGKFDWYMLNNPVKKEALLAAVLPYKNLHIFVKLFGDSSVVLANKAEFLSLVKSIHTDGN